MKTKILSFLFVVGLVNVAFGQLPLSYELRETMDLYNTNKFISEVGKNTLTENDIKGSPYLNDDFINGSIYTTQRYQYAEVPLRYNIYNDDLEFKLPSNEIQALATPEIVEKAVIGDNILTFSPYTQASKTKKGFFVVLEEGKVSLYAKPRVIFREAVPPGAYKDPEPAKFFRQADDYYLRVGTGNAENIGNKKELIAAFPDHQKEVETYISKNKIKTNKPEGLTELIKYYNSL